MSGSDRRLSWLIVADHRPSETSSRRRTFLTPSIEVKIIVKEDHKLRFETELFFRWALWHYGSSLEQVIHNLGSHVSKFGHMCNRSGHKNRSLSETERIESRSAQKKVAFHIQLLTLNGRQSF
jgi:hypothetical protein